MHEVRKKIVLAAKGEQSRQRAGASFFLYKNTTDTTRAGLAFPLRLVRRNLGHLATSQTRRTQQKEAPQAGRRGLCRLMNALPNNGDPCPSSRRCTPVPALSPAEDEPSQRNNPIPSSSSSLYHHIITRRLLTQPATYPALADTPTPLTTVVRLRLRCRDADVGSQGHTFPAMFHDAQSMSSSRSTSQPRYRLNTRSLDKCRLPRPSSAHDRSR
jgi:hypothetical protein